MPLTMIETLLALTLIGICFIGFMQWKSQTDGDPRLKAEVERKNQEIGELKNQLIESKSEKDKLSGQGKELYDRYKSLESDLKVVMKERDSSTARNTKYETQEEQKQMKHEEMVSKLEEAKVTLEDERMRIRREDEERQQKALEERDRMWAEHEITVNALLGDLVKKPQYSFTGYDNTNLPEGFDGSLKPDFMIGFLEQYVIFDSKVSKSQDLQNYISDAVKKTAKKVKGNDAIYSTIFLVVPTDAVATLKKLSFYEEGFTFYVVSPESLEPILASLKRIETYEFAQEMDPQERENIIDMIAQFDFHISTRNAVDFHLLEHGIETLNKLRSTNSEFTKEVMIKRQKIRNVNLNTADVKQMTSDPEVVHQKLIELTNPKAKLAAQDRKIG